MPSKAPGGLRPGCECENATWSFERPKGVWRTRKYLKQTQRAAKAIKRPRFSERMAIRVSHLSYAPLPGAAPVLQDIDFELPLGARCLCVGHNGAGKSTLLQLLAGQKRFAFKICDFMAFLLSRTSYNIIYHYISLYVYILDGPLKHFEAC